MSLKDIALPLIQRGIPVVPARPGQRASTLPDWPNLATTNPAVVEQWDKEYPDWNLVCVPKCETIAILDIDNLTAAQELGLPEIPDTLTSKTPHGFHHFFLHTDNSRALGNRDVKNGVGTIAEFKSHNKSVCAPGCRRDDGGLYKLIDESPLAPVPDALVEWMEKHSPQKRQQKDSVPVDPKFDFDAFLGHYGIEIAHVNGPWHSPRACPVKGAAHTAITDCGFFYDGEFLGWKDHAASCDGAEMSIGRLIKFMNEEHIPYEGVIWPEGNGFDVELADDVAAMESDEESPVNPKVISADQFAALLSTPDPVPEPTSPAETNRDSSEAASKYPQLRFPYEALSGQLKELTDMACQGGLSPGLVCPAIMALASSIPVYHVMEGARVNLYCCLLALVGAGKDTAIDRALAVLGMSRDHGTLYTCYSPSGERSVATLIGDKPATKQNPAVPGMPRHVIVTYELEDTLNKSKGETSSVLQALQWFYDHNQKTYSDSQTSRVTRVDCRLSWLNALPIGDIEIDTDTFKRAFGENTSHGLASRLLFGFSEEKFDRRRSRNWSVPYDTHHTVAAVKEEVPGIGPVTVEEHETLVTRLQKHRVEGFAPGVEELYLDWKPVKDLSGRDTYHILKVAIVAAIVNEHKLITLEDWKFAAAFMDWQTQIRLAFTVGISKQVTQAQFCDILVSEMTKRCKRRLESGRDTKSIQVVRQAEFDYIYIRWRGMANDGRWYKYGLDVEKIIDMLVRSGTLAYLSESEPDEKGNDKDTTNESWIRLVGLKKFL